MSFGAHICIDGKLDDVLGGFSEINERLLSLSFPCMDDFREGKESANIFVFLLLQSIWNVGSMNTFLSHALFVHVLIGTKNVDIIEYGMA